MDEKHAEAAVGSSNDYIVECVNEEADTMLPNRGPTTADTGLPSRGPTNTRSRSRSPLRLVAAFNSRFDSVVASLVRAEQAALSAKRVSLAAADAFHEEARVLSEAIADITTQGRILSTRVPAFAADCR